ncbi:MAG TPA: hypothetical protein VNT75_09775, partial [Symbiobacteriaceae bacterium]|nr:hypothetical protein [Symbiobacteriaceae bacterium]
MIDWPAPAASIYERWSPDGRYLVSMRDGDLWLRDAVTGESRNLTATPDRWEFMPAWAPDGKQVAFVSRPLAPGEGGRFWTTLHGCFCGSPTVVGVDGAGYRVLASGVAANPPSWSPDGKELAFEAQRGRIGVFDFQAGRVKPVPLQGFVSAPSFSPVRDELAFFFSDSAAEPARAQVLGGTAPRPRQGYALLDRRSGKVRVLHEYRAPFAPRPPAAWAANGRRVALNLTCQLYLCDPVGLFVVDLAARRVERIAEDAYQAVWETGGNRLAYLENDDRRTVRVFTFTTSGWERKTLRFPEAAEGISWRPASTADSRRVERVADVTGDGRPEVVTVSGPYGSGAIMMWFIHQGKQRIFEALVDSWRGPNDLRIELGKVTLTCRPLGAYDSKFAAHRQHTEVWRWNGTAYRLTSHTVPPAPTDRQGASDAEAYFARQDYKEALRLYRNALTLPSEEGADRDWKPHIRLRIRQAEALLAGRPLPEPAQAPPAVQLQAALAQGQP